jgi:serine/threonine-protein kinase
LAGIPTTIGRFEVVSRIGQGGMGALYRAWDPMLERHIAIKLLREDNDQLRERFSREARSIARLRHPNIVTIFDVGQHEGQPFIAMEYIQGTTLAETIRAMAPLTIARRLQLIEELCDGLAFAHRAGIVHRDVKPANLMVDEQGSLKILDFGIARVGPGMTQAGMLIGTLNYMSPEQVIGHGVDGRSDIFAVGSVLYEMLAYKQAFPGGLDSGILNKILQVEPEPLDTICRGIDSEIIEIVNRALKKAPADRYQDLAAMRKDLVRVRQRIETAALTTLELDVSLTTPTVAMDPPHVTPTPRTPRREPDREALARRRAAQIEAHLEAASKALAAGDYDVAIAACEQTLLLDTDNPGAADLLDRARAAIDERQANEWLAEAQDQFDHGDLTAALGMVHRAETLVPASERARALRGAVEAAREERRLAIEREEQVRKSIARARELFDESLFDEAVVAADEALAIAPDDRSALNVRQRAVAAAEAKRLHVLSNLAKTASAEARRLFESGEHAAALDLVAAFERQHVEGTQALGGLRSEFEARLREIEAARLEEERRRAEARRVEAERQERERRVHAALHEARGLLAAGDVGPALEVLTALEAAEPEVKGVHELKAEAEAQRRDQTIRSLIGRANESTSHQAAITALRDVLALDPNHKKAQELLDQRQTALERERNLAAALDRAAHAASIDAAVAALRDAVRIDPDHVEARRALDAREADLAREEEAARQARERTAAVTRALQAARSGSSHERALAVLQTALELDPDHEEAKRLYAEHEAALQAERERVRKVTALIATAQRSSTHDAAIAALREALALDGANKEARRLLDEQKAVLEREQKMAAALERAGRASSTEAAVAALREAARIAPDNTDVVGQLNAKEAVLAQEQAEAQRVRERDEAVRATVRAASQARTHEEALTALRAALELDPNHAEARRLAEQHEIALEREQAAARRRTEIAAAREQIEQQITNGDWDQADRGIQALEKTPDATKIAKQLRRSFRDRQAKAAREKQREHSRTAAAESRTAPALDGRSRSQQRWIARAVVSAIVLALGGWWVLKSRPSGSNSTAPSQTAVSSSPAAAPTPGPQSGPTAAAPVRPPDERTASAAAAEASSPATAREPDLNERESRLKALRLEARQQFARGNRHQALIALTSGLKLDAGDQELQTLLGRLSRDGRAELDRARKQAAGAEASAIYREAVEKERDAARLSRERRTDESLRATWEATDLFARAAAGVQTPSAPALGEPSALSAPLAGAAVVPPAAPPKPVEPPPQSQRQPQTSNPAPPPSTPPASSQASSTPGAQSTVADADGIRATLKAYEQAYSTLDSAAVLRVFPSMNGAALSQAFAQMRTQSVEILNPSIVVSGSTATVECQLRQRVQPKAGRANDALLSVTFQLRRAGEAWVIVSRK